jgi:hypothetical protein
MSDFEGLDAFLIVSISFVGTSVMSIVFDLRAFNNTEPSLGLELLAIKLAWWSSGNSGP